MERGSAMTNFDRFKKQFGERKDRRESEQVSAIMELEVLAGPDVQMHLNRNPRVIQYRGSDVFTVEYNPATAIPRHLSYEARALGIDELARGPYAS